MYQHPDIESGERGKSFVKLYMAVQRRLYGYILSLIPDPVATDDILQETVMVMWQHFDSFELGTDYAAWALAIARNQVFNYIKMRKKHQGSFSLDTMHTLAETAESSATGANDRLEALRNCVKKLSSKDAQLLALRYDTGATVKSVSERVGQSLNTLYHRLYKIRIGLLECIERQLAQEAR
ncbi:sigma-70 family RNA polymerase sigma factor [Planctomycetota bacterium]